MLTLPSRNVPIRMTIFVGELGVLFSLSVYVVSFRFMVVSMGVLVVLRIVLFSVYGVMAGGRLFRCCVCCFVWSEGFVVIRVLAMAFP